MWPHTNLALIMKVKLNSFILGFIFITALQFTPKAKFFRWFDYHKTPATVDIVDEVDYAYIGYTLRQNGISNGWSMMNYYQTLGSQYKTKYQQATIYKNALKPNLKNIKDFNYPIYTTIETDIGKGKEHLTLVQPFVDHPPLAPLLYSLPLKDINDIGQVKPDDFRKISVYLSILNIFLFYIFTFVYTQKIVPSILSSILYSSLTGFVLSSRFALLENTIIPLSLINLTAVQLYQKNSKKFFLYLNSLAIALALLTKLTAVYLIFIQLYLFITKKITKKDFITIAVIVGLINLPYYIYLYYISPQLLISMFIEQSSRPFFGSLNFLISSTQLNFNNFPIDAVWLFSFISILLTKKFKKLKTFFLIGLLSTLLLSSGNYPWYYLIFIPYLIFFLANFIYQLIVKPKLVNLMIFIIMPISSLFYWGYIVYKDNHTQPIYRLLIILPIIVYLITKKFKLKMVWSVIFFLILIQAYQWSFQAFQYQIANFGKIDQSQFIINR